MESVAKSDIEKRLLNVIDGQLNAHGFRAVDVDCYLGGRGLVRVFIERLSDGSASVADCEKVSHLLGQTLDQWDEMKGPYDLEVSSPGLERRLRLMGDFERNVGSHIRLKLLERLPEHGLQVTGQLLRTDRTSLWLFAPKGELEIPLRIVKRATRVEELPPARRRGKGLFRMKE